jgi:hypothetical protein
VTHHFTPETENVEFIEVTTNCMAAINSLNRLICNKHGENIRRVASCCNYLIKLKQQILIHV